MKLPFFDDWNLLLLIIIFMCIFFLAIFQMRFISDTIANSLNNAYDVEGKINRWTSGYVDYLKIPGTPNNYANYNV